MTGKNTGNLAGIYCGMEKRTWKSGLSVRVAPSVFAVQDGPADVVTLLPNKLIYGKLKGKTFRLSNMGDETPATMRELLTALDECLG